MQRYHYDPSGQLLRAVDESTGEPMESYAYDKAGNMLEKVIDGTKTVMTYNAANQLTSVGSASLPMSPAPQDATADLLAKIPRIPYFYDKAGRMLGAAGGARSDYGWLDKVITLTTKDGAQIAYDYWPDGQLASKRSISPPQQSANLQDATADGIRRVANLAEDSAQAVSETYLWDGLALLRRGDTIYINEPHPSGGSVIASFPKDNPSDITYYLNDLLGTTLATVNGSTKQFAKLTAFGQPLKQAAATASPTDLIAGDLPANPVPETDSLLQATP